MVFCFKFEFIDLKPIMITVKYIKKGVEKPKISTPFLIYLSKKRLF
ncbi:hypothetical protein KU06112801_1540005 [Flavobacterium psychrophilum]|nr:hypothetical protein KU06112801_1540005 [Flavobacterium psychrophilum]SNB19578.1 hypothetical protein KU05112810_890005 [Flavobacterium psychrophilum]